MTSCGVFHYGFRAVALLSTTGKCLVSRTLHYVSISLLFTSHFSAFFTVWTSWFEDKVLNHKNPFESNCFFVICTENLNDLNTYRKRQWQFCWPVRTAADKKALICIYLAEPLKMYFIRIESFVFSNLVHCTNTLPVLKSSFSSVLFSFVVVGFTGGSKSSWEANLSSGRWKGNHCHWSSLWRMKSRTYPFL